MLNERILRAREGGVSVLVGTADAEGAPAACRGIAVDSRDEFETLIVYVPVATSQETLANVATTRRIAVTVSHPVDHASVQFKGSTKAVRLARPDEAEFVRRRLSEYAEVLVRAGLPRHITMRVAHSPAFAIEMSVEHIFNQTPGPNAGAAIR